jgi:two-component system nitrogen regulation response regulator NtrX
MLAQHFVRVMRLREGLPAREWDPSALDRLEELNWSGNVRELRNTVERLLILAEGDRITADDVGLIGSADSTPSGLGAELLGSSTFQDFKEQAERAFLLHRLRDNEWNVSETARLLEMPRSNLYKKMDRYGLRREN